MEGSSKTSTPIGNAVITTTIQCKWPQTESSDSVYEQIQGLFKKYMSSMDLSSSRAICSELLKCDGGYSGFVSKPVMAIVLNAEYTEKYPDRPQGSPEKGLLFYIRQTNYMDNAGMILACLHDIHNSHSENNQEMLKKPNNYFTAFILDKDQRLVELCADKAGPLVIQEYSQDLVKDATTEISRRVQNKKIIQSSVSIMGLSGMQRSEEERKIKVENTFQQKIPGAYQRNSRYHLMSGTTSDDHPVIPAAVLVSEGGIADEECCVVNVEEDAGKNVHPKLPEAILIVEGIVVTDPINKKDNQDLKKKAKEYKANDDEDVHNEEERNQKQHSHEEEEREDFQDSEEKGEDVRCDDLDPLPKMKPQTGGRWKALMESSAWRNYRRNRRKLLREGCKSMDDDDAYRQIRKNALSVRVKEEGKNETDIAEKAVNKWMSIIDQTKLLSKNLLDSSNASNDGTALSQRTPKENAKDLNDSDKTSSSGEKLTEENRAENSPNSSAPPKPPVQRNNANSESSHLFGEVEALECLLGEQEDEIDEIEDELTRCKKEKPSTLR